MYSFLEVDIRKTYIFLVAIILYSIGMIVHGAYTGKFTGEHSLSAFMILASGFAIYILRQIEQEEDRISKTCSKKDQDYFENILRVS